MTRHALLIRPDFDALAGFENGAACIDQVLRSRGFQIERCERGDATRAGILRAYDALIARAKPDDAVVIYYVGHGGLTTNQTYTPGAGLPRYVQNICPTDFGETTDDDFRGISSWELSLQLAALTRKAKNVTVILECCFAAQLARGGQPADVVAARPTLTRVGLTAHLQALRARARELDALELTGNAHAVRVAAAGQTESSFQVRVPATAALRASGLDLPVHGWIGAMTLGLAEILAQVGAAHVSWRSIAAELRSRLHVQRPEIEGPVARVPFSLATVDAAAFPVSLHHREARLEAGSVLGVSRDDVYGVMPPGATRVDRDELLAELTIDEVSPTRSRARRIRWCGEPRALPANAVALATSLAFQRLAVRVVADDDERTAIEAALQRSARVRAATPDDHDEIAELRVRRSQLELRDARGPLFAPAPYPARLRDAVADLENLATERHLRAMSGDQGIAPGEVVAELVVVGPTGTRTLAHHEALGLGDRLAFRFNNRTHASMYANVFNLGLRRRIAQLSTAAARGLELLPDQPAYLGDRSDGQVVGFELHWPVDLPRDQPRLDTMLIVVTRAPADLSMLASREHLGAPRGALTPLQGLLDQLGTGRSRGSDGSAPEAFAIRWLDYVLYPIDASLDFGQPEVEASPPGSPPPRVEAARPRTIRLDQLAVAANTRLDVLVCARSATTPFHATTVFGDAPSELELWRGELRGPAEVYVWSSPRSADQRTMAELLALRDIAEPVGMLRAGDGDPRARLAPGASMQLAAMARTALLGVTRELTTVFRGAFGAEPAGTQRYAAPTVGFAIAITPS